MCAEVVFFLVGAKLIGDWDADVPATPLLVIFPLAPIIALRRLFVGGMNAKFY